MEVSGNKKEFLTKQLPQLIANLQPDTVPHFGLMTAQHMVEHLIWVTKSSAKRYGEPEGPPTRGQLGFRKFIDRGAIFEHRPKNKTKADLPPLKYDSLAEAVGHISEAVDRFYNQFESDPSFKAYSPMMGELSFEDLELFHYQHFRYHFWQFGLLESYV